MISFTLSLLLLLGWLSRGLGLLDLLVMEEEEPPPPAAASSSCSSYFLAEDTRLGGQQ